MARPRSPRRRAARLAGVVALAVVLTGVIAAVVLVLTNPEPEETAGWSVLAPMPAPRGEVAAAVTVGGELVVAGGLSGLGRTSTAVSAFDGQRWRQAPDLPEPRHHAGAAALGDDVYVSGGAASTRAWTPLTTMWRLPAGGDAWEQAPPMPEGRWGHRMVALGDRLYIIGGRGSTARVLVFEPGDGWSAAAAIPRPRDHLGAVVLDGEIWALGGRDEAITADVDIYDPAADRWRAGPPLPEPTSAAAVGVVDGHVVVVGGEDPAVFGGGIVRAFWRLNSARDGWVPLSPPPLAVHGAADGVLDGRLVVAGGAGRQGWLSVTSWTAATQALEG